jgi:hypothetical protein
MATLVKFPEANDVLRAAPGTEDRVNDLPIFRQPMRGEALPEGQDPCVVACFKFSPEEIAEINRTGVVYHMVLGYTHAPVSLHAFSPFVQSESAPTYSTQDVATALGLSGGEAGGFVEAVENAATHLKDQQ